MRVLVTGAAGFIGGHVVSALLARGRLNDAAGASRPITELVLADIVSPPAPASAGGIAVRMQTGDFRDPDFPRRLLADGVDSVFHLAAALTIDAETDFARGMAVNVDGLIRLLEACRARPGATRLVFASSMAAFGGPLPKTVDDSVAQTPQTSYGAHKAIAELLLNDYARRGFVDARSLRLPVVMTRPGAPTPTVSDRIAAILREPLLGRDVDCPLAESTRMPFASVQRVAQALIDLHELPPTAFGHTRAMNLPALSATVGELIAAVRRRLPSGSTVRITVRPDPALQAIVDGWPGDFVSECASRHGIGADPTVDALVDAFLQDRAGVGEAGGG
jgi:nucleoside-diphosphate-sugar epimerase